MNLTDYYVPLVTALPLQRHVFSQYDCRRNALSDSLWQLTAPGSDKREARLAIVLLRRLVVREKREDLARNATEVLWAGGSRRSQLCTAILAAHRPIDHDLWAVFTSDVRRWLRVALAWLVLRAWQLLRRLDATKRLLPTYLGRRRAAAFFGPSKVDGRNTP